MWLFSRISLFICGNWVCFSFYFVQRPLFPLRESVVCFKSGSMYVSKNIGKQRLVMNCKMRSPRGAGVWRGGKGN